MTKTFKKSMLVVLMFVMAFASAFAIANVKLASADEAKVNAFTSAMAVVEAKGIDTNSDTSILADAEKVTAIKDAKLAYDKLTAEEKAATAKVADFEAIYNKVLLDAETIVLYNNTEIYKLVLGINGAKVTYSQKALFEERKTDYNALDAYEKAYVDAATNGVEYFAGMESAFTAIEGDMDLAKTAIVDIKAFKVDAMVNYTGAADEIIVVKSFESINNATEALKEIYDVEFKDLAEAEQKAIIAYVTEAIFNNYKNALAYYNGTIVFEADQMTTRILNENDEVLANQSYFDDKAKIETLEVDFEAIKNESVKVGAELVNDLTTLVSAEAKTKLAALSDGLDAIESKISTINAKIDELIAQVAVDTANGVYTADCKDDIYNTTNGVEAQFAALESYVQENVATIVDQWGEYVDLKADYDAKAAAVVALKDAIDDIVADDSNIVADFDAASKIYAAFVPNQKSEFDTTDYNQVLGGVNMPYYLNAYKYVQAMAGEVAVEAAKFATRIDNLVYEFSVEFYQTIVALNEEYKALDENIQNAITNYNVLKGYIDKYISELGGADGWKAAVELVLVNDEIPTITYAIAKDIVDGPIALWTALDATLQGVVATNSTDNVYYATYVTYMQLKAGAEKVIALYTEAETKLNAINVANKPAVGLETTNFVNAFHAAETALNALATGTVDVVVDTVPFVVDYDAADAKALLEASAKYADYETAEVWCETFDIEAAIDALYVGDELEATAIANVTYGIREDLEECETKYGAVTEGKRDYYITKLASARTAYNLLAAEVNAWILSVAKLIDANATEATMNAIITAAIPADLIKFDLDQADDTDPASIISIYNAIYTAEKEEDLKAAKEMFDAIYDTTNGKAYVVINQLNADIADINALPEITPDKLDLINDIEYRYQTIHQTQRDLIDATAYDTFKNAYNKANFQKFYSDAVAKLEAEVNANVYTKEGATLVSVLQSLYIASSAELQGLVAVDYKKLGTIADKYVAADPSAYAIAKLQAMDKELAEKIANLDTKLSADIAKVADDLEDLGLNVSSIKKDFDERIRKNAKALEDLEKALHSKVNDILDIKIPEAIKAEAEIRDSKINALNDMINDLAADLEDAKIQIKADYEAAIEAAIDAIYAKITEEYTAVDNAIKADLAAKVAELKAKDVAIDETIAALDAAVKAADAALKAAIEKEAADREAADKELENKLNALEEKFDAEIKTLNTKLLIASIILAVFTAALIGAVVYIFLKMFKKEN